MKNMKDRIYKLMTELGVNQKEFAQMTGISPTTLSSVFNGRTMATLNQVLAIHTKFPDIRLEWLMFGEGEMREGRRQAEQMTFSSPTLFDENRKIPPAPPLAQENRNLVPSGISKEELAETLREALDDKGKQRRSVVEIRVFFDDGTYDVFRKDE